MSSNRRPKGAIEASLMDVCNDFVTGQYKPPAKADGTIPAYLTPVTAATVIAEREATQAAAQGEAPEFGPPSAGAVTNVFKKWRDCGYAVTQDEPFAFVLFGDDAFTVDGGADELIRRQREAAKAAEETDASGDDESPSSSPQEAPEEGSGESAAPSDPPQEPSPEESGDDDNVVVAPF